MTQRYKTAARIQDPRQIAERLSVTKTVCFVIINSSNQILRQSDQDPEEDTDPEEFYQWTPIKNGPSTLNEAAKFRSLDAAIQVLPTLPNARFRPTPTILKLESSFKLSVPDASLTLQAQQKFALRKLTPDDIKALGLTVMNDSLDNDENDLD